MVSADAAKVKDWPTTAEDLLKKRYEAFTTGDVNYILETHHPETRDQVEASAVENWSKGSKWKGLKIHDVNEKGDKTFIHFTCSYERNFETFPHTEIAEFRKTDGKWFYYDSEFPNPQPIKRDTPKAGRNDPCPCGSGKKFKKCCWGMSD